MISTVVHPIIDKSWPRTKGSESAGGLGSPGENRDGNASARARRDHRAACHWLGRLPKRVPPVRPFAPSTCPPLHAAAAATFAAVLPAQRHRDRPAHDGLPVPRRPAPHHHCRMYLYSRSLSHGWPRARKFLTGVQQKPGPLMSVLFYFSRPAATFRLLLSFSHLHAHDDHASSYTLRTRPNIRSYSHKPHTTTTAIMGFKEGLSPR